MKRQLLTGLALFLITPGVFLYQPSTSANASEFDTANPTQIAAQADEPEGERNDVPWGPILILALIVPTAALLIPSFYMTKRHDDGKGPPS